MSIFKSFALVGLGLIGRPIASELLQAGFRLRIVTRDISKDELGYFRSLGAEVVSIIYDEPSTIVQAFEDMDVVISTLSSYALQSQLQLLQPAKDAGVKLFVPSEFGGDTQTSDIVNTAPFMSIKPRVRAQAEAIGMPWLGIVTGPFASFIYKSELGWDLENRKVTIAGDGNAMFNVTHEVDVGGFTVQALLKLDLASVGKGKFLYTCSFYTTRNKTVEHVQHALGVKLDVQHAGVEAYKIAGLQPDAEAAFYPWWQWQLSLGHYYFPDDNAFTGYTPKFALSDVEIPVHVRPN